MKHPNVTQAFELLLDELNTALQNTREQAAASTQRGNYDDAQAQLDEARRIEKYIAEVRTLQRNWMAQGRTARPAKRTARPRLPRGERTPEGEYRLPILRAVVELGGEAKMAAVLEKVYAEMKPRLKPADLEPLPSDQYTPRWRNTAQWARLELVREGLLKANSPHGIWAITEKGRKHLAPHA